MSTVHHNFSCEVRYVTVRKESNQLFIFLCTTHSTKFIGMLGEVSNILNNDVTQLPDDHLSNFLLFGSQTFNEIANRMILDATVSYIIQANRFK